MILGWMLKLYETYENCKSEVGKIKEGGIPLLPISHSIQIANIEVVLNEKGDFLRARILEKDEAKTIIPVTEDSSTRSSGITPHPLCDKLQYVAGDYVNYVNKKNGDKYNKKYLEQLKSWCDSAYVNNKVYVIYKYLKKKELISDLIRYKILITKEDGTFDNDVKIGAINQSDSFVRFRIEIANEKEDAIWLDKDVYYAYINYYLASSKNESLCYVQGKRIYCSEKHPYKVRHIADKAKLISANDNYGFTYRGRFSEKNQVLSIGYETSQKAHNALRWLIDKQGYKNGEQVIIAWATKNKNIPNIFEDTYDSIFGKDEKSVIFTQHEYANRLNKAIAGYGCDIDIKTDIIIMGLDSATTGRLSITYYKELKGVDFLDRIKNWHRTCSWQHNYKKVEDGTNEKGKQKYKNIAFIGAPAPIDIALCAYGNKVSDKLKKATVERLLPCIIDKARLPYDIVNSSVNRVSNPVSMEKIEWEKVLTITCALIKKYKYDKFKEVWEMALDENQLDRSYLFGRLLAIAQEIERWAIKKTGEKRATNAERLMHQFKIHPYKSWGIITDKLRPYIERLGTSANVIELTDLMVKVNSMITYKDFKSQKKLDDSYILGYYCQRQVFIDRRNERIEENNKKKLENKEGVN